MVEEGGKRMSDMTAKKLERLLYAAVFERNYESRMGLARHTLLPELTRLVGEMGKLIQREARRIAKERGWKDE